MIGKGWQWPGDHAESFNCSKRALWPPEPGHRAEDERWLELMGILQKGKLKKPNWKQLLSEGSQGAEQYFNITKRPNVSKVLEGDIRVERQEIGYAK